MEVDGFVINETAYACWDWELKSKNREFLEGIEPDYFCYLVRSHADQLEGENQHKAALTLRLAYSHGLETLFALLCTAIQAPRCAIGWMLNYRNADLVDLVKKVSAHRPVYTRLKGEHVTWMSLAKLIHSHLGGYDEEKRSWIQDGFGKLWRRFAGEFVDENFTLEYNCIKHGLRAKPGGFELAVGPEDTPGVPAPPEKMMSLGGSKFGSSYFIKEQIIPADKCNFRPRRYSRNWSPYNIANGLLLISMSINNVIGWLRIIDGAPAGTCRFENPTERETFDLPWNENVGVNSFNMDLIIEENHIQPFSRDEILKSYEDDVADGKGPR